MNPKVVLSLKILTSIAFAAITVYLHIEKQNELTALRMKIPAFTKQLKEIEEENRSLHYSIATFENPTSLLKLLRTPSYSHMKHPSEKQQLILKRSPSP